MRLIFLSLLIIPFIGSLILFFLKKPVLSSNLNWLFSLLNFIASLTISFLFWQNNFSSYIVFHQQLYLDALNLLFINLVTFIGMTTAWFSRPYMLQNVKENRITDRRLRLYHILYQLFMLTMLFTLVINNIGLMWVAMEGATLTTVLLVSLYRTPEAIEAAWKYFIICVVGIALALFGTVLVYFAAHFILPTNAAILWTNIVAKASKLNITILNIAFIFLFVGFGTKIGLVPLHSWLPDAHSESPGPMSTLLSGLLLNIALYCLLRFKIILDLASNTNHLGRTLFILFGLLSLLFAAIAIYKQRNLKRLFSYSSIEHMGFITCAFGIGGPVATVGALIYLVAHALAKSAVFTTVANIIHIVHTQHIERIRALISQNPALGWIFVGAVFAIAGMPPFGIFAGEVLVLIAAIKTMPLIAILLIIGLIIALAGMLQHLHAIAYGKPGETKFFPVKISKTPAVLHLILITIPVFYLPTFYSVWLTKAATIIMTGGAQ